MSIALYVLAAFNHKRADPGGCTQVLHPRSVLLRRLRLGIALTYGATGSTNLPQIADYLSKT